MWRNGDPEMVATRSPMRTRLFLRIFMKKLETSTGIFLRLFQSIKHRLRLVFLRNRLRESLHINRASFALALLGRAATRYRFRNGRDKPRPLQREPYKNQIHFSCFIVYKHSLIYISISNIIIYNNIFRR